MKINTVYNNKIFCPPTPALPSLRAWDWLSVLPKSYNSNPKYLFFLRFLIFIYASQCIYVCHLCGCLKKPEVSDPLELELQVAMSYLRWTLETELRSSRRAASALSNPKSHLTIQKEQIKLPLICLLIPKIWWYNSFLFVFIFELWPYVARNIINYTIAEVNLEFLILLPPLFKGWELQFLCHHTQLDNVILKIIIFKHLIIKSSLFPAQNFWAGTK